MTNTIKENPLTTDNNKEKTLITDNQQTHNKLKALATTRPTLFTGHLYVNHKTGKLELTNLAKALAEKFKGLLGYPDGTNHVAIQAKAMELLEKEKDHLTTNEDQQLAKTLAQRAGKTAREIFNQTHSAKNKAYSDFFTAHAKELERWHVAKFWQDEPVKPDQISGYETENDSLGDGKHGEENATTTSDQHEGEHYPQETPLNEPILETQIPAFVDIPMEEGIDTNPYKTSADISSDNPIENQAKTHIPENASSPETPSEAPQTNITNIQKILQPILTKNALLAGTIGLATLGVGLVLARNFYNGPKNPEQTNQNDNKHENDANGKDNGVSTENEVPNHQDNTVPVNPDILNGKENSVPTKEDVIEEENVTPTENAVPTDNVISTEKDVIEGDNVTPIDHAVPKDKEGIEEDKGTSTDKETIENQDNTVLDQGVPNNPSDGASQIPHINQDSAEGSQWNERIKHWMNYAEDNPGYTLTGLAGLTVLGLGGGLAAYKYLQRGVKGKAGGDGTEEIKEKTKEETAEAARKQKEEAAEAERKQQEEELKAQKEAERKQQEEAAEAERKQKEEAAEAERKQKEEELKAQKEAERKQKEKAAEAERKQKKEAADAKRKKETEGNNGGGSIGGVEGDKGKGGTGEIGNKKEEVNEITHIIAKKIEMQKSIKTLLQLAESNKIDINNKIIQAKAKSILEDKKLENFQKYFPNLNKHKFKEIINNVVIEKINKLTYEECLKYRNERFDLYGSNLKDQIEKCIKEMPYEDCIKHIKEINAATFTDSKSTPFKGQIEARALTCINTMLYEDCLKHLNPKTTFLFGKEEVLFNTELNLRANACIDKMPYEECLNHRSNKDSKQLHTNLDSHAQALIKEMKLEEVVKMRNIKESETHATAFEARFKNIIDAMDDIAFSQIILQEDIYIHFTPIIQQKLTEKKQKTAEYISKFKPKETKQIIIEEVNSLSDSLDYLLNDQYAEHQEVLKNRIKEKFLDNKTLLSFLQPPEENDNNEQDNWLKKCEQDNWLKKWNKLLDFIEDKKTLENINNSLSEKMKKQFSNYKILKDLKIKVSEKIHKELIDKIDNETKDKKIQINVKLAEVEKKLNSRTGSIRDLASLLKGKEANEKKQEMKFFLDIQKNLKDLNDIPEITAKINLILENSKATNFETKKELVGGSFPGNKKPSQEVQGSEFTNDPQKMTKKPKNPPKPAVKSKKPSANSETSDKESIISNPSSRKSNFDTFPPSHGSMIDLRKLTINTNVAQLKKEGIKGTEEKEETGETEGVLAIVKNPNSKDDQNPKDKEDQE